jgi:hypothetical protein
VLLHKTPTPPLAPSNSTLPLSLPPFSSPTRLTAEAKKLVKALHAPLGTPATAGHTTAPSALDLVVTQLQSLLFALAGRASLFHERRHEGLLKELLDAPLWHVPPQARSAFLDFWTHLVVANGALVQPCLQTLVYSLLPPPGPAVPDAAPGEAWRPSQEEEVAQDDILQAMEKASFCWQCAAFFVFSQPQPSCVSIVVAFFTFEQRTLFRV